MLGHYKTPALDVKRAEAATPETRDALFDMLGVVVKVAARENADVLAKHNMKWNTWADVQKRHKHNMDEVLNEVTKGRNKAIAARCMQQN